MYYVVKLFFSTLRKLNFYWRKEELLNGFYQYGENFRFDPLSIFIDAQDMSFGDNVFINIGAHFSGSVNVGNDVMFGPYVSIFAHDHYYAMIGKQLHEIESLWNHKPVSIGNHCWIGANVTIVAGSQIGDGSVIAAGSVVSGKQPPYCLLAGSPAAPIRKIFSDEELLIHLNQLGYGSSEALAILKIRSDITDSLLLKSIRQDYKVDK